MPRSSARSPPPPSSPRPPASTPRSSPTRTSQIVGRFALTNTNPAILALLNDPTDVPPGLGYGLGAMNIWGASRPPQAPSLHAHTYVQRQTRLALDYELTVESGPAGAGIAYDVNGEAAGQQGLGGCYRFARKASDPVEEEPAPDVRLDLGECAGVVKLVFEDLLGNPVSLTGGNVTAFIEDPPGSGAYPAPGQARTPIVAGQSIQHIVSRGDGLPHKLVIRAQTGTDAYLDLLIHGLDVFVTVGCDEIVEKRCALAVPGSGGPGFGLGEIRGVFDVQGEREHDHESFSLVAARNGPWGNYRLAHPGGTPSSGPYVLSNVMPSDVVAPGDAYELSGEAIFRLGRRFEHFMTPRYEIDVPDGATVDVGEVLVVDPGYLAGEIHLAGPPPLDPAIGSTLEDIRRASDRDDDADGIPDALYTGNTITGSVVSFLGTDRKAPGARHDTRGGFANVEFDGAYDALRQIFAGGYEAALGGLERESAVWELNKLILRFEDRADPGVPESWQDCTTRVGHDRDLYTIDPGVTIDRPLRFCFSQLNLRYRSVGGNFIEPAVYASGFFSGVDFEAMMVSYQTTAFAYGTPRDEPGADRGLVVATFPQGRYNLDPRVAAINPGGGTSSISLNPLTMRVGCRQLLDVWTDFWVDLDPLPQCTSEAEVTVSGTVRGPTAIDRIEYWIGGSGPTVACTSCGVEPAFSFPVPIGPGRTEIELVAVDVDARAARGLAWIEQKARPGDLGNVLLAVRDGVDAWFHWRHWPGSLVSELMWEGSKEFPSPATVWTRPAPIEAEVVPGAVSLPTPLLFYRIRALNCAGDPGP